MIKNRSKYIGLLSLVLLWSSLAQAQESVNTSGGDATGNGGTVAYSIGQVVFTNNMGSNGSEAQGVQQAYEIFSLVTNESELNIILKIFPNPISENLNLQISGYNNEKLSYQLVDIQGKLLDYGQVTAQLTQIKMHCLPSATYLIHFTNQENKEVQSFKIIKN